MTAYLPYALRLRSSVSLHRAPGWARPEPIVAGAALRAIVADRCADHERAQLCFDSAVRYLPAYPGVEVGGGGLVERTLPTPASWRRHEQGLVDLLAGRVPDGRLGPAPGFLALHLGAAYEPAVSPRRRTRTQRDPIAGRATADRGALFETWSVPAGTLLAGVIAVDHQDPDGLLARLREVILASPLLLGRARRAGYGGTPEVSFQPIRAVEVPTGGLVVEPSAAARLLLISPYAGRDRITGSVGPATLATDLAEAGVQAGSVAGPIVAVSGWNRSWRGALPTHPAAGAGTVVEIEAVTDPDLLGRAQHRGIGLRRAEGFGRFVLLRADLPNPSPPSSRPIGAIGTVTPAVERLERALADLEVDRYVVAAVRGAANQQMTRAPSRSLLGRLRNGLAAGGLATLEAWLHADGPNTLAGPADRQLRRARLGDRTMRRWLEDQIEGNEFEREVAGMAARCWLVSQQRTEAAVRARRDDATRLVIDGVLRALARVPGTDR